MYTFRWQYSFGFSMPNSKCGIKTLQVQNCPTMNQARRNKLRTASVKPEPSKQKTNSSRIGKEQKKRFCLSYCFQYLLPDRVQCLLIFSFVVDEIVSKEDLKHVRDPSNPQQVNTLVNLAVPDSHSDI